MYGPACVLASLIQSRLRVIVDGTAPDVFSKVGEAVFRFKSQATPLHPQITIRWFLLSYYSGKPRRCAFIELQRESPNDGVSDAALPHTLKLRLDGAAETFEHISGHALACQFLEDVPVCWSMAEIEFIDVDLRRLQAHAVLHEVSSVAKKKYICYCICI